VHPSDILCGLVDLLHTLCPFRRLQAWVHAQHFPTSTDAVNASESAAVGAADRKSLVATVAGRLRSITADESKPSDWNAVEMDARL
jgi:hypothetical protein